MINKNAKNSHSNKSKIPDEEIKLKTKQITECTEFCKIITDNELTNRIIEKNKNKIFVPAACPPRCFPGRGAAFGERHQSLPVRPLSCAADSTARAAFLPAVTELGY